MTPTDSLALWICIGVALYVAFGPGPRRRDRGGV